MSLNRRFLVALAAFCLAGPAAMAQTVIRVRGTIVSVDASAMKIVSRSGETVTLKMTDKVPVSVIAPIAIDAIKPGSYIGTAAVAGPDGMLQAREIQVFPEAMRGVGEGHRPWDLEPGSTMTNGTVGDLKVSEGRVLTLGYKGGEQKVFVPPNAPVITYEPGTLASLVPGGHVIMFAEQAADGSLTAVRAGIGKDGLVPPM